MKKTLISIYAVLVLFFVVASLANGQRLEIRKYFFAAIPLTDDDGTYYQIGPREFRNLYVYTTRNGRDIVMLNLQSPAHWAIAEADPQFLCMGYTPFWGSLITAVNTRTPVDATRLNWLQAVAPYMFDVVYQDGVDVFRMRWAEWSAAGFPGTMLSEWPLPHRKYAGLYDDGWNVTQ